MSDSSSSHCKGSDGSFTSSSDSSLSLSKNFSTTAPNNDISEAVDPSTSSVSTSSVITSSSSSSSSSFFSARLAISSTSLPSSVPPFGNLIASSIAATEGSPPSSPRSTISSCHSFNYDNSSSQYSAGAPCTTDLANQLHIDTLPHLPHASACCSVPHHVLPSPPRLLRHERGISGSGGLIGRGRVGGDDSHLGRGTGGRIGMMMMSSGGNGLHEGRRRTSLDYMYVTDMSGSSDHHHHHHHCSGGSDNGVVSSTMSGHLEGGGLGDFSVNVRSEDFKFSCGHFVAYKGYRERLHGHNYTVGLSMGGPVGNDGYVMDFDDVKIAVRQVCKSLNEYFIVPMSSDVLDITIQGESISLRTEDGAEFLFPKSDCMCLPIVHSTAEELAFYIWSRIAETVTHQHLTARGISWMEVSVAERPCQEARVRRYLTFNTEKTLSEP